MQTKKSNFDDKDIIKATKSGDKLLMLKETRKYLTEAVYYEDDTRTLPTLIDQYVNLTKNISGLEPNPDDLDDEPLKAIKKMIKKDESKNRKSKHSTNRKPTANKTNL
jgi:hypothetical protein